MDGRDVKYGAELLKKLCVEAMVNSNIVRLYFDFRVFLLLMMIAMAASGGGESQGCFVTVY